jgi:hypothetical protein
MSKEPEVDNVFDVSESHAYTYEVTMVIQIVAPNRTVADAKLDQDGGYISKREVKFIKSTLLYGDETSTEEE